MAEQQSDTYLKLGDLTSPFDPINDHENGDPSHLPAPDQQCPICSRAYGTQRRPGHAHERPCQPRQLPCGHLIGSMCLQTLLEDFKENSVCVVCGASIPHKRGKYGAFHDCHRYVVNFRLYSEMDWVVCSAFKDHGKRSWYNAFQDHLNDLMSRRLEDGRWRIYLFVLAALALEMTWSISVAYLIRIRVHLCWMFGGIWRLHPMQSGVEVEKQASRLV
jgi:hypothetical protein